MNGFYICSSKSNVKENSKVAPTKNKLSIPKKELNAIVLGCIKSEYLMNILKIPRENIILHIDSMVCLHWIQHNYEKLKVYVSNRVNKIQKCNFKIVYVPGELNPSDYVTKKTSVDKYLNNRFWQHGPEFLKENTEDILEKYEDIRNLNLEHKEEAEMELKPKLKINNNIVKKDECPETTHSSTLSNLIDKWRDLDRILRVTSWCLKTIALMTNGIKDLTRRSEIQQQSFSIAFIDENIEEGINKF